MRKSEKKGFKEGEEKEREKEGEERDCTRENEKEKKRGKYKIRGQEGECQGGTGQQ